jgi:aspartyl-tRNA(Asn)/glutamyl-tRNA(Gln) amidotransferase subunit A
MTAMAADLFTPVGQLAKSIREKKLSPVSLVEASLERLDTKGRGLNAVATLAGSEAIDRAREAEKEINAGRWRGPLHGIPYGAKDLLATKSMPTTWGAEPYRNQRFDYDATVIQRLEKAGAILTAKLAMVELAGGMGYNNADAAWTGPGLNPWNKGYWSGGSSSGPGSAVAAGLVSFAIGSETVGSILTPSAFSGVTGLRPTYGLVSRHGAMALCWTLDKLGPMARTAEDCALVLAAIAGRDPADPTSVDPPKPAGPDSKRLRIGIPKAAADWSQPEVVKSFESSVAVLSSFADVVRDVVLPDLPFGLMTGPIVGAEGAAAFLDLVESGGLKDLRAKADRVGYSGSMIAAVDYIQALRLRERARGPMMKVFFGLDAIAAPTRASVAFPIGTDFDKAFPEMSEGRPKDFVSPIGTLIQAGNAVGFPALSMPNGFGRESLPTGLQFLAGPFGEDALVSIGKEFQSRTDFHLKRPPGY